MPARSRLLFRQFDFSTALRFRRPWDFDQDVPSPKKPRTLPIILSPEEVVHFLGCVVNVKQRTILTTCYAPACASARRFT